MRQQHLSRGLCLFLILAFAAAGCAPVEPVSQTRDLQVTTIPQATPSEPEMVTVTATEPTITATETVIATSTTTSQPRMQLTYIGRPRPGYWGIYAMDVSCPAEPGLCLGSPELLFELPSRIFNIVWSPDGSQVVFTGKGVSNKPDIFLSDWDGSNLLNLTSSPGGEGNPVWSPDGKQIAYIYGSATEEGAIRSLNLEEGDTERLLEEVFNPDAFDWLPQNRLAYIAQISSTDGRTQITVTDLEGQVLNHIPTNATDFTSIFGLAPSPNGASFAFTGEIVPSKPGLNTSYNIYITDITQGDYLALTDDFSNNLSPAWYPMGDRIAFASDLDGSYDIYLITTDGSGRMKVTESSMDETNPAWRLIPPP